MQSFHLCQNTNKGNMFSFMQWQKDVQMWKTYFENVCVYHKWNKGNIETHEVLGN
jgi:hypothetical protein